MYSESFQESIRKVEANRAKNAAMTPRRMTAEEKDALLKEFHPDYRENEFELLKVGPNKGDKVPHELAAMLQAHPRVCSGEVDLSKPAYDVDVLVIGGGGAGSSAAIEANETARQNAETARQNAEQGRAAAEQGACDGKLQLAKRAKELGYDAVHDTVHEMAKDEARHGAGFEGLLKRYFK